MCHPGHRTTGITIPLSARLRTPPSTPKRRIISTIGLSCKLLANTRNRSHIVDLHLIQYTLDQYHRCDSVTHQIGIPPLASVTLGFCWNVGISGTCRQTTSSLFRMGPPDLLVSSTKKLSQLRSSTANSALTVVSSDLTSSDLTSSDLTSSDLTSNV